MEKRKYDHSKKSVYEATGFSKEEVTKLQDELNETAQNAGSISQAIEQIAEKFTKDELAYALVMQGLSDKTSELDSVMSKILGSHG